MNPNSEQAYKLLHNGALALSRAELQGIRCDVNYLKETQKQLTDKIKRVEDKLYKSSLYKEWQKKYADKTNLNSNPQLSDILYNELQVKPSKTTPSEKGSVDEEALKNLKMRDLDYILMIRKLKKIRDTYLKSFEREQVDGYIHPSFNLHIPRTYRSSSNNPNFQNIPTRDVQAMQMTRQCLFPRPGHQLLEVDYSGLEFMINACYSQDPVMVEYCHDPKSDPHADIARQTYFIKDFDKSIPSHKTLRSAAKNAFVFPELYGDYYKNSANGLACRWGGLPEGRWRKGQGVDFEDIKLSDHLIENEQKSLSTYTEHIKEVEGKFFRKFKKHKEYMEDTWEKYLKTGEVSFYTGFTCQGLMSRNEVLNYPIQGSAFHCLLWSFIELDRLMRQKEWDTKLIGQIHDSIIMDIHPDELDYILETVRRVTCKDLPREWPWIIVPLDVDAELAGIDCSWAGKKGIKI